MKILLTSFSMSIFALLSCTHHENPKLNMTAALASNMNTERTDTATFGTGCFCFNSIKSRSAGGQLEHPSEVNNSTSTGVRGPLGGCAWFLTVNAMASKKIATDNVRIFMVRVETVLVVVGFRNLAQSFRKTMDA